MKWLIFLFLLFPGVVQAGEQSEHESIYDKLAYKGCDSEELMFSNYKDEKSHIIFSERALLALCENRNSDVVLVTTSGFRIALLKNEDIEKLRESAAENFSIYSPGDAQALSINIRGARVSSTFTFVNQHCGITLPYKARSSREPRSVYVRGAGQTIDAAQLCRMQSWLVALSGCRGSREKTNYRLACPWDREE